MSGIRAARSSARSGTIAVACLLLAALAASFLPGRKDGDALRPEPDDREGVAAGNALAPVPARRQAVANADTGIDADERAPASAPSASIDRDAAIAAALQRMRDAEEPAEAEPEAVSAPSAPPARAITLEPEERDSLEAKALAD